MKKNNFLSFLIKEKSLWILSVILLFPSSALFSVMIRRLQLERNEQILGASSSFILTFMIPLMLLMLISIALSYYFAVQRQIQSLYRSLSIYYVLGETIKKLRQLIIGYYLLLFGAIVLLGVLFRILTLWFILPSFLMIAITLVIMELSLNSLASQHLK